MSSKESQETTSIFSAIDNLVRQHNPVLAPNTARTRLLRASAVANLTVFPLLVEKSKNPSSQKFVYELREVFDKSYSGWSTDIIIGLWCRNELIINNEEQGIIDQFREELTSNPRLLADILLAAAHGDLSKIILFKYQYNQERLNDYLGETGENRIKRLEDFITSLRTILQTP